MAAKLQRDLGEPVTLTEGKPSEFTVLVDGTPVVRRGAWALLGMVPPYGRVLSAVRTSLAEPRQTKHEEPDPGGPGSH